MNNWNCQKCNFINNAADRFCLNCGEAVNFESQSASDLPPTVVGFQPPIVPNQQNFAPNQTPQTPPNFGQQPNFQQQPSFQQPSPQSSSGKKIALIGGIIGLIVVVAGGIALWFGVISPYFKEQARLKKEYENGLLAKLTSAKDLLPEEYTTLTNLKFRKGKMMDKMQLLQASQNLPPELKSELSNINDAVAAEYVRKESSSQKVLLQILKYNSPAQAAAVCDKVGSELEKKKASLDSFSYHFSGLDSPDKCKVEAEDKNKVVTKILSRYGFLIIASGHKDNAPANFLFDVEATLER